MARVSINLEDRQDLATLGTTGLRIASGLVPGEPNQVLVAELRASPARLPLTRLAVEPLQFLQQLPSAGV